MCLILKGLFLFVPHLPLVEGMSLTDTPQQSWRLCL